MFGQKDFGDVEAEITVLEDDVSSDDSSDDDDEEVQNTNIDDILDREDLESYKLPYRIPCAAHRMSNIAKVDSEKEAILDPTYKRLWRSVDAKCQSLFNLQSKSTKAADTIRKHCDGVLFKIPNATRY